MSSVRRYSQKRTVKQIDLIYISKEWFSNGECLVIDK